MNRSILIVICDFLLVSLLAFSTVDINKATDEGTPRMVKTEIVTNQLDSGKDLAAVMRLALDEERRGRDQLIGELTRAREAAARQQATLGEREQQLQAVQKRLDSREQQVQTFQQELQTREQEATRLRQAQTNLEQQTVRMQQVQSALEQQVTAAQANLQNLNQQLQTSSTESILSKERLAAMQAALALMQASNQVVLAEKQRLSTQLEVAEVERRHAAEQVGAMQEQVKVEREEKVRLTQQNVQLAEGVKVLAKKSEDLAQEVRENRPLTPNQIYNEFLTNRVQARINAVRPGLVGSTTKDRTTDTLLVTDGTNVFAICHIGDTPLTLFNPGTDWDSLTGNLTRSRSSIPIRSLCFYLQDPRLVFMPLTAAEVRQIGGKAYTISSDPYKFQDAVLVGATDNYYGECRFQIDPTTPDYVKLDSSFLRGLFGKFNPSRGDLVLSKTGELLGVMANSSYCLMIRDFNPAASFRFGPNTRDQRTGMILSHLYSTVSTMPMKLQ